MRFIRACGVGVVILVLAGCTAQGAADPTTPVSTRTTTHPASTAAPVTVTSTIRTTVTDSTVTSTGTRTTSYAPPPATKEPAPVQGECPYLSTDDVSLINGQRLRPDHDHRRRAVPDLRLLPIRRRLAWPGSG